MTEPEPASAPARKTVLIVDDDQGTLHVLTNGISTILDMFEVLTATNGREAIEHLERRHVDALVTDLAMPVMDGFALIAYVTNLKRPLPVVVLSGLASGDIGERLAPYGGLRVLHKPASYQDVAESLLQAMEHVALGHVEGIPLSGVLQLVESERRSCTVVVTSGRRKGRLSFQSGRLIDAYSEDFGADGEPAAYDILGWDDTSIAFEHLPDNVRRTIHTPMQLMLIEVAVTQDAVREQTERSIPPAAHIDFATTGEPDEPTAAASPSEPPEAVETPDTTDAPEQPQQPEPPASGEDRLATSEANDTTPTPSDTDAVGRGWSDHTDRDDAADGRHPAAEPARSASSPTHETLAPSSIAAAGPNGSEGAADDVSRGSTPTDRSDEGTTMTGTDPHVTALLGAVERLTNRAREADAALAAVAAEVEAFREAQRTFDAVNEQRERRRRDLEAFRHDVASLAREILGRVDGMFATDGAAAVDPKVAEVGTTP